MSALLVDSYDYGAVSHFAVLAALVHRTVGKVLELGVGWGSTPMLRLMCKDRLESYDNSMAWAHKFGVPWVNDWKKWEPEHPSYDVIFIDCAPDEYRKDLAARFKNRAKFIVCHDAECDTEHGGGGNYQYDLVIDQFRHVTFYRTLRPHTLILSNVEKFIP